MAKFDDGCPRCGTAVEVMSSDSSIICLDIHCTGMWTNERAYDRECIARGLAGKKRTRVGEEYLTKTDGADSLYGDLQELVALVGVTALQHVRSQLVAAMDGRSSALGLLTEPKDGEIALKLMTELRVLRDMRDWIDTEIAGYGAGRE